MADRYYKVRVRLPSGKIFERECFRGEADEAARAATWISFEDHKTYNPKTPGVVDVSRLPEGWGQLSEEQRYAVAVQAGYRAIAVASYVDQQLTWRAAL